MNCVSGMEKWLKGYGNLRAFYNHVERVYKIYYWSSLTGKYIYIASVDRNTYKHNMAEAKKQIEPFLEMFLTFET